MASPAQRVQVIKEESTASGGDSADQDPFYAQQVINETQDALSASGLYVQKQGGPADTAACVWREGNDLLFKDTTVGTNVTLAQLLGLSSGYDFLLECDPPSPTNDYAVTRTSDVVTQETWKRHADATLIKSIDYTRASGVVTQEVRKVFATDGSTIIAQETVVYTRTSGVVTSATRTRNV